jgi:hypothetical protein
MKWSQALCTSILIDGLYSLPPIAGSKPRGNQDFPDVKVDPAFTPNALAPDWGLAPRAGRPPVLNVARYGILRRRLSGSTIET